MRFVVVAGLGGGVGAPPPVRAAGWRRGPRRLVGRRLVGRGPAGGGGWPVGGGVRGGLAAAGAAMAAVAPAAAGAAPVGAAAAPVTGRWYAVFGSASFLPRPSRSRQDCLGPRGGGGSQTGTPLSGTRPRLRVRRAVGPRRSRGRRPVRSPTRRARGCARSAPVARSERWPAADPRHRAGSPRAGSSYRTAPRPAGDPWAPSWSQAPVADRRLLRGPRIRGRCGPGGALRRRTRLTAVRRGPEPDWPRAGYGAWPNRCRRRGPRRSGRRPRASRLARRGSPGRCRCRCCRARRGAVLTVRGRPSRRLAATGSPRAAITHVFPPGPRRRPAGHRSSRQLLVYPTPVGR